MLDFIDTHCHLDFPHYEKDREEVIVRAKAVGVSQMIVVATALEGWEHIMALAARHTGLWAALGLHPMEAAERVSPEHIQETLISYLQGEYASSIVALGETGLDKWHQDGPALGLQIPLFHMHLALSVSHNVPVVVHSRGAEAETLACIQAYHGRVKGVLHSFTGSLAFARALLDAGFYISFSGILTFAKNHTLQETASFLPMDRILVETDSPFLCPKRGSRNEPSYVVTVAEMLASIKKIPLEAAAWYTTENAKALFGLSS